MKPQSAESSVYFLPILLPTIHGFSVAILAISEFGACCSPWHFPHTRSKSEMHFTIAELIFYHLWGLALRVALQGGLSCHHSPLRFRDLYKPQGRPTCGTTYSRRRMQHYRYSSLKIPVCLCPISLKCGFCHVLRERNVATGHPN